ncbi:MAG: chemotaxis protein CheD [Cytophagaceae bacterium]|jgi:chemotaxis protein CheD|nr:chemotaxis protein CheD [Cytophagaceae bacterium]
MDQNFLQHFLYPSTLFASKEPYVIKTILGSCIAVCFYDPVLRIGGMNHYMLPNWNGNDLLSPKYGNVAIEKLTEKMLMLGSKKENLTAKVFGGGDLLSPDKSSMHIGERNIRVAEMMLTEYKIPIIASSTGGTKGRKILFDSRTGEVRHKFLNRSER